MPYRLCALYLDEADARGGALDVDEHRPRGLILVLAALFPGHFHKRLAHDRRINNGVSIYICMVFPLG